VCKDNTFVVVVPRVSDVIVTVCACGQKCTHFVISCTACGADYAITEQVSEKHRIFTPCIHADIIRCVACRCLSQKSHRCAKAPAPLAFLADLKKLKPIDECFDG
jgi:hypothetical protein